jgi:orotidine-5'-phosphate decarboxylase
MESAIDRLFEKVNARGHVCVGLDTCIDYVPQRERSKAASDAQAVLAFNKALIDSTYDVCACFKVQIAYYEEMGIEGLKAYSETLKYIRSRDCIAIADIKRGDIADTAVRYSKAHFSGDFEADFVTLNPYLGMDTIEPWMVFSASGKGAFVLMMTSNPGMKDFEYLQTSDGKRFYDAVGNKMAELAASHHGKCGYGFFGVVTGCTQRDEAAIIRERYPNLFFLIPGYGAQGGGAKDASLLLRDGNGGVVNASRSIITAWQKAPGFETADNNFAAQSARKAAIKMRDEILSELNR